jgi:hypothetical protein
MTEQLLDVANVGAVLEHVGGTRVPEEMAGASTGKPGSNDVASHKVAQPILDERLAVVGEEEGVARLWPEEQRPNFAQVPAQPEA